MKLSRVRACLLVVALAAAAALAGVPAHAVHEVSNVKVTSLAADAAQIAISVFKPDGASATSPVPVLLQGHGWGGSRWTTVAQAQTWLDDGFGIVSIDQRGHGETGGIAYVMDPNREGQDIRAIINYIATLDWVSLDAPGDPVLGALGGSYGGGYQLIGALTEVRDTGSTRINALAPEITWNDLPQNLAPNDVARTLWDTVLYAAGVQRLPQEVHIGNTWGFATGQFPDGSVEAIPNLKKFFHEHSPDWFTENAYNLNIPVAFYQGMTDNLFPLNEAWHNFTEVLTPAARAKSLFIGFNGGHALPSVLPPGAVVGASIGGVTGDACGEAAGGWTKIRKDFFRAVFAGGSPAALPGVYNLAKAGGGCVSVSSLDDYTSVQAGPLGTIATTAGVGGPIAIPLLEGPATVAGIPRLRGTLTTVGIEARAFFGLSVGTTPADARLASNNVLPLRRMLPVIDETMTLELPGVAIDVPAGETLFLTVSAVSDMFFLHGSRTPGVILITGAEVDVPLV
jgi:ABC-2 type transport system ATP-binding protein